MKIGDYTKAVSAEIAANLSALPEKECVRLVEAITGAQRVFLTGAGRSGLVVRAFAMRLMHLGYTAYVTGETVTPGIAPGDLLIVGSGSGETAGLAPLVDRARSIGAEVALVTTRSDSSLARLAGLVIRLPMLTESTQPKGSLFEQSLFVFFEAIVLALMERLGVEAGSEFPRHANLE